jgi:uncharacterized RDD family membrane protein YckC
VLASGEHTCSFCDSTALLCRSEDAPPARTRPALHEAHGQEWRGELNQRLQAYRSKRPKGSLKIGQSALPFDNTESAGAENVALQVDDPQREATGSVNDFAFTIAIGRIAKDPVADPRLLIDVSLPPESDEGSPELLPEPPASGQKEFFPLASLHGRRRSLLVDGACLAFAYGGFLALFGSLGGHFALDKLSAAVCVFTFAFVYLQYFGLFTIFGGSTPGMMVAGLQVASFTGDEPTPRQYFLRATGYMLSAGTCFLGFLWALWDEDGLTWHDHISETYLTPVAQLGENELHHHTVAQ